MAGNLCAALDALLQCLLGGGTASSVKYADRYETQLNKEIIDAETRMQTALQHAKDTTLHKSDRLKHFSSAKQLERQIQTKYQQLRILDQARFSKEENQNRRAFLAVIRKSKLPTIRQIEGTSEQLDETDEQVAEMMDAFKAFAPDDSTLEAELDEFLQQESTEVDPILNAPPIPRVQLGRRSARVAAAETA